MEIALRRASKRPTYPVPAPNENEREGIDGLPLELDDMLRDLRAREAFYRLSIVQQYVYAEWVSEGADAKTRARRAMMVGRVVRRLV
ncbi:MAG: YdeI/OmpD-associated family protein [Deltaproteobacteria bacterium]|nr:YdeI/OmpD-associated family protein [Deltaproteobacteria bacterium]